jgi:WD40 repeat protein
VISADGRRVLSGSSDGSVRLWDLRSGKELRRFTGFGEDDYPRCVALSDDGRRAAAGGSSEVRVWDAESGKEIGRGRGHTGQVLCLAFSPDGRRVASGSVDHTIRLWDAGSGKPIRVLEGHQARVLCLAFSPDGRRLLSGGGDMDRQQEVRDCSVRLWEAETGREVWKNAEHKLWVNSVCFSPDGRRIVSADAAGFLHIRTSPR